MPVGEFYGKRVGCYKGVHRVLHLMVVQEVSTKGKVWGEWVLEVGMHLESSSV
jgi:hypothetical protein